MNTVVYQNVILCANAFPNIVPRLCLKVSKPFGGKLSEILSRTCDMLLP